MKLDEAVIAELREIETQAVRLSELGDLVPLKRAAGNHEMGDHERRGRRMELHARRDAIAARIGDDDVYQVHRAIARAEAEAAAWREYAATEVAS